MLVDPETEGATAPLATLPDHLMADLPKVIGNRSGTAAPAGPRARIVLMPADDYCYLTTTGRRTGRPHRIEIWYFADGETLYLLSGGGRSSDWVANLLAEPLVQVEIDGKLRNGCGRVLEGGEEAERARSLVFDKYAPRSESDLTGWRNEALPVAIDLGAPEGQLEQVRR